MKKSFAKIFISFVAIIYIMSTVGVSVFSHYCGGELEKVTLFSKTTSCCGKVEELDVQDDCCKNEIVHVSFQKDFTFYTLVNSIKSSLNQLFVANSNFSFVTIKSVISPVLYFNNKDHPPNLIQKDLVSCSVIRI